MTFSAMGSRRAVRPSSDAHLVGLIDTLARGSPTFSKDAQFVQDVLRSTVSPKVRAAAAMALVDNGVVEAVGALSEVLARPGIAANSGTLLFALNELGGSLALSVAVSIVESGSFEGRGEALTFLEEGRTTAASDGERRDALSALERLAAAQGGDCADAAALALEYLAL